MTEQASTKVYQDLVHAAQETRLLADVLGAIAATNALDDVFQTLRAGISGVLPAQRWSSIRLLLTAPDRRTYQEVTLDGTGVSRYWSSVQAGAEAAGRALGAQVEFLLGDAAGQVDLVRAAVHSGAAAIAVAPIDPRACEPGFVAARTAGIPLILYDTPGVPDTAALAYVGTDNAAAGRLAGEVLRRLLPEGGLVCASCDSLRAENGRQRVAGFGAALDSANFAQLPVVEEEYDAERGAALTAAALRDNPALVGLFGATGGSGPTWGTALAQVGRAGQVRLVCFDLAADAIELLTAGVADAVVAQREHRMGYQAVELLAQMLVDGTDAVRDRLAADHTIDTGVDIVTLGATPWSTPLAEHLVRGGAQRPVDSALRQALAERATPPRIVVIGMLEVGIKQRPPQLVNAAEEALASAAIQQGQTIVTRTADGAGPDVARAQAAGQLLLAAVPLVAGSAPLGALVVSSPQAQPLDGVEQARLERIASAVAVAIRNAQLFQQLEQRASELSRANARQEQLLQTINELSSPVVPIAPGVLVLPLVGAMDSQRSTRFLETLLVAISARQAEVVLIDISGVPVVDTSVAFHLTQTARAVRLLGAEVVLSGITAPVAQTMTGLGIELRDLQTRADLQSAFAYALTRIGGQLSFGA